MFKKVVSLSIAVTFLVSSILPAGVSAQTTFSLPAPGTAVSLSPVYHPTMVNGMTIDLNDPLKFDFLIDTGGADLKGEALNQEALKLVKYFLVSLTIPEEDLWVNLSPYEQDRIISAEFGKTTMGRDMLAQDNF